MRTLFISERRYIENILWKWKKVRHEASDPVLSEHYAPPRTSSTVRFNNDFSLYFVPQEKLVRFKSFGTNILPNTIGADVFLTVDEHTLKPLMTELLAGEAFSMKYFKEYIEKVENRLSQLSVPINLQRTSYCRIFVIENNICFLAFPNDYVPTARGKKELLCVDVESSIACCRDENKIVYVDGWIRTFMPENELKLEAFPEEK